MKRHISIEISPDNDHPDVQTLDDLYWFILNELESAGIGAFMAIINTATDGTTTVEHP